LKNVNGLNNANLTINPLSEVNPKISASVESVCDKEVGKILSYSHKKSDTYKYICKYF
jgi:hypothetical protein